MSCLGLVKGKLYYTFTCISLCQRYTIDLKPNIHSGQTVASFNFNFHIHIAASAYQMLLSEGIDSLGKDIMVLPLH